MFTFREIVGSSQFQRNENASEATVDLTTKGIPVMSDSVMSIYRTIVIDSCSARACIKAPQKGFCDLHLW